MGLQCSLLGHDYGETEREAEQDRRGGEKVLTVREFRRCRRCGAETVVSENTEVTSVAAEGDDFGPANQPTATDDGSSLGEPPGDAGRTEEAVDADPTAGTEDDRPADDGFDPAVEDDAIILDDGPDEPPDTGLAGRSGGSGPASGDVGSGADGDRSVEGGDGAAPDDGTSIPGGDGPTEGVDGEAADSTADDDEATAPDDADDAGATDDADDAGATDDADDAGGADDVDDPEAPDDADDAGLASVTDPWPATPDADADESADDGEPGPWPTVEGEDEGFDAEPGSGDEPGSGEGPAVEFGGLTPEVVDDVAGADGEYLGGDGVDAVEREDEAATLDGVGITSVGPVERTTESVDAVLVCPECGFEQGAVETSLRAGDICPEPDCGRGYLTER